jgi:hypothetical protein
MTFNSTTYTAPSGSFVANAASQKFLVGEAYQADAYRPIYNPAVLDQYTSSYEVKRTFSYLSDEWFSSLGKFPCRVAESDFDLYAEKLVKLTEHTLQVAPHCLLGPLRGAAKPCATTEVMARGQFSYDYFNFQAGSNAQNHGRITADLVTILKQRDPGAADYRINVTDTARGGQGINALVALLREIHEGHSQFRNQRWILDLNLLHDTSANTDIGNIESVKRTFSIPGKLDIELNRYPVTSLIVEDYDPALAVELVSDGQSFRFKPCAQAGSFLYQVGSEVRVIDSHDCYQTFEKLYSESITQYLITSPKHEQDGVVWQEYQQK